MPEPGADDPRFARLGHPRRLWTVAAIHGEVGRLERLHDAIAGDIRPGDRLVYLGNMIGLGGEPARVIDEILSFRRAVIGRRGMLAEDVVFLRGAQEEMWHKLLQLQLAPNPGEVLAWMGRQGIEATVMAYGGSMREGAADARAGAVAIGRWTQRLRLAMRRQPGHEKLMSALRRAAFTGDGTLPGLLFVHSGIDPDRPLDAQADTFWWATRSFEALTHPYAPFLRVIRGFDPAARGLVETSATLSLDAGSGRGGKLLAALLDPEGVVLDLREA